MNYYDKDFRNDDEPVRNYGGFNSDGTYRYSYETHETKKKKEKKGNALIKVIALALVFGIVAGGTGFGVFTLGNRVFGGTNNATSGAEKTVGSVVSGTATSKAVAVNDVSDIAQNVMPAIVQVTNMSVVEYRGFFGQIFTQPAQSSGSGVIIGEDESYIYIASNNHVISNSREITITFTNNDAVEATLQGTYPAKDLAVIKVDKSAMKDATLSEIKIATLADSDEIKVGQATVAIGNALGYGQSVTAGIISAIGREVSLRDETTGEAITNALIQTDAAINPGNSGGALLNMNGEVIGIVSAKYSDTKVEGMGYAIPITEAKEIIDEIITNGAYTEKGTAPGSDVPVAGNGAYLGIYGGMDIDSEISKRYDMPQGVYVSQVVSGSGADNAGIRSGDVIRAVDGKEITSMTSLQSVIAGYNPGDMIKVRVAVAKNGYADTDFTVILGDRNEANADN